MFELLTIDLDGTLADTVGDLQASVNRMQRNLNLPERPREKVQAWVGNGIERLVHRALTNTMDENADPVLFNQALAQFYHAYETLNGEHASLYPGVKDGLDYLRTLNIPLVVVTNKSMRFTRPLLHTLGIDHYFQHTIGGDTLAHRKPHPAQLLHAAELCDAPPEKSLLIGDSVSDIKAGRAAGFTVICVSYGYNHNQSVRDLAPACRPDAVIDSFKELPVVLSRAP